MTLAFAERRTHEQIGEVQRGGFVVHAGAESGDVHELPASKFHEADTCYTITMDALGADTPADVELAVFEDRDVVLKLGSGHRTLVALPPGGDAGGVSGELGGGQFKLVVQKKQ